MATTVRTTTLQFWVLTGTPPSTTWVQHTGAFAATCTFGFDQRYAEAEVRTTVVASAPAVTYWSEVRLDMGCTPGAGVATRFRGYVVPLDQAAYPLEGVLHCRGYLYRASWVRNQTKGGTDLAGGTGTSDQAQVQAVLTTCGVPFTAANVAGTGKALGSIYNGNPGDVFTPGPYWWQEGEPGLSCIERLDEVSVPDDASGRYRTFETLAGDVYRIKLATTPTATPDFSFTEGVDVLDAKITRDPTGAGNKVIVDGASPPGVSLPGGIEVVTFTAGSAFAPYLPPGLPTAPDGHAYVGTRFASPLIEKSLVADPGSVLACEAIAQFLLAELNCVIDTLEFSTPRDDLLGPGQTIHLQSPRLGITDTSQHYWLQHLEITLDERGQFTQRLSCVRKS